MRDCIAIAKALGDPQRVRAMMALRDGELCLCQLIEMLKLSPSTVSKHMAVLHQARLVETRKEGRWVYYRLSAYLRLIWGQSLIIYLFSCLPG